MALDFDRPLQIFAQRFYVFLAQQSFERGIGAKARSKILTVFITECSNKSIAPLPADFATRILNAICRSVAADLQLVPGSHHLFKFSLNQYIPSASGEQQILRPVRPV